jgi:Zn-dependent M28 family amino/carboxypeptidase
VILLGLAERLAQGSVVLGKTQVTLAFFGGEEVSMQGSRAFVRSRPWNMPTAVINLELLGQNGPYVTWQSEGNVLTSAPTDPRLSEQVRSVIADVTGQPARPIGGINSDGYSFILVGLPTCVLGSYDRVQGGGGLHRPTDAPSRVELGRLAETIQILEECVQRAEAGQFEFASDVP